MPASQAVSILTASLRSEFYRSWTAVAAPADWKSYTTVVNSTTAVENYVITAPVPGMQLWSTGRNYSSQDSVIYSVPNLTFHTEVAARLEDVEDEQINVLTLNPAQMSEKAKLWPGRSVLKLTGQALGAATALQTAPIGSYNAFDGLPFFGTRTATTQGAFGVGQNLLPTFTSASSDGLTFNLVAFYYGNEVLKPLAWQERSGPDFRTNSGDNQSMENREIRWWVDLRGAPFFTWWFNAVAIPITNTPNVAEMHSIYNAIVSAFRSFRNPITVNSEDGEYIHEQTIFDQGNLYFIGSAQLSEVMRQSLTADWIPQNIGNSTVATTNTWLAAAKWTVSNYLNNF